MSVQPTKDETVNSQKEHLEIEKSTTQNNEVAASEKKVIENEDIKIDIESQSSFITMKQVNSARMVITRSLAYQWLRVLREPVFYVHLMQWTMFPTELGLIP